jgi:hypothetical protein
MHGETTHGKGSASRVRNKKTFDSNFDQIRFPSRRVTDVYWRASSPVQHVKLNCTVNRDNVTEQTEEQ